MDKVLDKDSNEVITDLILSDFLVKSQNKQGQAEMIKKILEYQNIIPDEKNFDMNDNNEVINNTEEFKNKVFSIIYCLFLNPQSDVEEFKDEIEHFYNPSKSPITTLEVDDFINNLIQKKQDDIILQKLIKCFKK